MTAVVECVPTKGGVYCDNGSSDYTPGWLILVAVVVVVLGAVLAMRWALSRAHSSDGEAADA